MGMTINTNISALNSYRNLSNTQGQLSSSLEKLSSGLRINRAADDAAGLAISEGLRSQAGGLTTAARNAQDGISVIQTAEGSLTQVHAILQRLRDLAVQAGNDSNSTEARQAITTEATSLTSELSRTASATNFNGIKLLDGSSPTLNFQVGADGNASSQIQVDLASANVGSVVTALGFGSTAVQSASAVVGGAATQVHLGSDFQFKQGGTVVTVTAPTTAPTNVAGLVKVLNADNGFSQNFTASADAAGKLVVTSRTTNSSAISINQDYTTAGTYTDAVTATAGTATMGFDSAAGAQAAITAIDQQITNISSARANLGAVQNRFSSAINSLNVSNENITAAQSRIRDTDMAAEMVNFTRANLLQQAGTAMLAQANQSNNGVLKLLG
ncbi:MAG: flagellin [Microbacteriaceae bacterium]|jgi:flagellin|nr:flagellin [Microbacteriaceae bacterium]HEV7566963.1 flagellin [Microbacteriaceae bacterium]